MRTYGVLLALSLVACTSSEADITLTFTSAEARNQTRLVAFTAFEPVLAQPDTEDRVPRFISCDEVGVFPPTRIVDPDTIATQPNLAGVISERTTQSFPLDDDWLVDLKTSGFSAELNPWGAVMVYVEALGDARVPDERGGGRVSTTLLSGCFCLRTQDGSHPDIALDQRVKQACVATEGTSGVTEQDVVLGPVVSSAFRLENCDGITQLTAPRNELLSPGPAACVATTQCDELSTPGPCFDCEQPCSELDDRGNVPVQFDVFRDGQSTPSDTEVVLTDSLARAQAQIEVGDCSEPIRVDAHIVGRTNERSSFEIECVDTVSSFDCAIEVGLQAASQPRAIAKVPGNPAACASDPNACDRLAVLSEDGSQTTLNIHDLSTGTVVATQTYGGEIGRALVGYMYDLPGPSTPTATTPLLAVATSRVSDNWLRLRVFRWDYENQQLVPHDGADGILEAACEQSMCGSLDPCGDTNICSSEREVCSSDTCQVDRGPPEPGCAESGPLYCDCQQVLRIGSQTRVTLRARDIDGDSRADLISGSNDGVNLHFFYSGQAPQAALYGDNCVCGLFGVTPNAFGILTFGGQTPDLTESDVMLGTNGGLFVNYARETSLGGPRALRCGASSAIGDTTAVRDIRTGALRCRQGDIGCLEYDDAVTVSARTIVGGSLNDPGTVLVLSGSEAVLSPDRVVPNGVQRELVPRSFPGQTGRPEDPQRAEIADFNGDRHRDLAVLYKGSQEIHVWLGASNGGFGEVAQGVSLRECTGSVTADCPPLSALVALDSNGDGREELAVVCSPSQEPRLRLYSPQP